MKLSLSVKISILVISLVILGGAITTYLVYTRSANALKDSISSVQLQLTRQSIDKIDRFLHERTVDVQELTDREFVQRYLSQPSSRTAEASSLLTKQLNHYRLLGGAWENLSLVDAKGTTVLSTDGQKSAASLQEQSAFKDAYAKAIAGEVKYTDLFAGADGAPVMLFMAPVRDASNAGQPVVGVVVGELAWQSALEIMRSIEGSQAILLNKQGTHIGENSAKGATEVLEENHANSSAFRQARNSEGVQILPGVDQDNAEDEAEVANRNESFVTSYARESGYLDYTGNGWTLILQTPVGQALAPVSSLRSTVLLLFVLMAAVTAVLTLLFARRFIAPIKNLTQLARQISGGNLQQRMPVTSRDEVGTLAQTFNAMTEQLAGSYAALEQKVAERTQQLQVNVAELAAAKAKDDAILANMGEGLVVTDNSGHLLLLNPAATQLLEIDPAKHIGHDFLEAARLTAVESKDEKPDASSSAVQNTHQRTSKTYTLARKNGHTVTLVITTTAIMQNGQNIGAIGIIRDITKEKEVDRMKTEFISLASHQLRTPLSAIRWFTEMLLSGDAGELSQDQKDFAKNIYDSADRMIELVNSLLNISRIESGRIIVDPKPTDLNQLVGGVVNDLKAKTEEKKQTLILSVHKDLPKVNLDPRLIGQVYMNFLTNAIKYTPKGGEVSVFVSRKGEELVSQITDNGYGIPTEQQGKVFRKFFRADNISKIETDGTGLGLYLVKAIIESSGGRVWFESAEGKGTTFWFTLPMSGMKAREGEVTLD